MDYSNGLNLLAGRHHEGNPTIGLCRSRLEAEFINMLGDELVGIVEEAGLEPDYIDRTQLRRSVKLIAQEVAKVSFATVAVAISNEGANLLADHVKHIDVRGHTVNGVGHAQYRKVDFEPAHPGKFHDASDQWWELNEFEVTPQMFGAIGDSTGVHIGTDDSSAFNKAVAYCVNTKAKLIIPNAGYRLANQVVLAGNGLHVEGLSNPSLYPDASLLEPVIIGGNLKNSSALQISNITINREATDSTTENIGFRILCLYDSTLANLRPRECKYNFIFSPLEGGCAYNDFYNLSPVGGDINMMFRPEGTLGYCNENNFWGGRFFTRSNTVKQVHFTRELGATFSNAHNRFYGMCVEGSSSVIGFHVEEGSNNLFHHPRCEGLKYGVVLGPNANENHIEGMRADTRVWDDSIAKTNTWNMKNGDFNSTSNNGITGLAQRFNGVHATAPATIGIQIQGISKANPCLLTAHGHGLSVGSVFIIYNASGMTEMNGKQFRAKAVTINTITLQDPFLVDFNTMNYTTYTGGGYIFPGVPDVSFLSDANSSVGQSVDIISRADSFDATSIRGLRAQDGLERWRINTNGSATFGRSLEIQQSSWAFLPLRLGAHCLWIDTTGRLRIKNGEPTSETDGTIVGTQS